MTTTPQPDHAALHAKLLIIDERLASHIDATTKHIARTESAFEKIASRFEQGNVLFERVSNSLANLNEVAASGRVDRDKMDARIDVLERAQTERATERRIAGWFLSWRPIAWLSGITAAFVAWLKVGAQV